MNLREQIEAATADFVKSKPRSEAIECQEWDRRNGDGSVHPCVLFVRTMSGEDRDEFDGLAVKIREADKVTEEGVKPKETPWYKAMRARLLVMCVVDADGKPVFQPDDYTWLSTADGRPLQRLYNEALDWNRITRADIDELKKTSEPAANVDSGSSSPAT